MIGRGRKGMGQRPVRPHVINNDSLSPAWVPLYIIANGTKGTMDVIPESSDHRESDIVRHANCRMTLPQ